MEAKENWDKEIKKVLDQAKVDVPVFVWDEIETQLSTPQSKSRFVPWYRYTSAAATILVMMGAGIWWFADQYADFNTLDTSSNWHKEWMQSAAKDLVIDTTIGDNTSEVTENSSFSNQKPMFGKENRLVLSGKRQQANRDRFSNVKVNYRVAKYHRKTTRVAATETRASGSKNINLQNVTKVTLVDPSKQMVDAEFVYMSRSTAIEQIAEANTNTSNVVIVTDFKILKKPIEKVVETQQKVYREVSKFLDKNSLSFDVVIGKK